VLKEVDKALADQKVSGRRMVIEEVEGSEEEEEEEEEEALSTPGQGSSNGVESLDNETRKLDDNPNPHQTQEAQSEKTKDEGCVKSEVGAGDAEAAAPAAAASSHTQSVTAQGDTVSPDDNLPPAVLALKDAGNTLFRQGQYGDALDKYNAAVQLLGQYH